MFRSALETYERVPEIVKLQHNLEQQLGEEGRMVIRPSGTEPVIRVMVEGADREVIEEVAYSMASCIQKTYGRKNRLHTSENSNQTREL